MKFAHIADLHIGKKLGEVSLLPDQEVALSGIARDIQARGPDAVFLAGDVYDHPLPGADAVALFDRFLNALIASGAEIFVIGGNHDSQERLCFARDILSRQGLHIARPYEGHVERFDVKGVWVYLLPYVRPKEIERFFEGARFESMEDAVSAILAREEIDPARENVLVTHLFASARGDYPETSDSEINPVGGLSEVDVSLFDAFCYVALGHLHAPQKVGREGVRYAGSPIKYSFSEMRHKKSFVMGRNRGRDARDRAIARARRARHEEACGEAFRPAFAGCRGGGGSGRFFAGDAHGRGAADFAHGAAGRGLQKHSEA